jgi:hypothetical protein
MIVESLSVAVQLSQSKLRALENRLVPVRARLAIFPLGSSLRAWQLLSGISGGQKRFVAFCRQILYQLR